MQIIKYPERNKWETLTARPAIDSADLEKTVRKIMEKVRAKGDKALKKFTKDLDAVKLNKIQVSEKEIQEAENELSDSLKAAIRQAKENIETFHAAQRKETGDVETMPFVNCWRRAVAIERIGCYIPGGSAPLFSTVLMIGVPARLAGCKEIILCSPPGKSGIHPAILYSAKLCGIENIFKVGGAQAIAAMTFGTETIPRVFKIFGPGNQYVTMAKQLAQKEKTAIDIPAGPSEVLIIADETADPGFVAADLLSQAEHGPDSQVMLLTNSESMAEKVIVSLTDLLEELPRKEIAKQSLKQSKLILVRSLQEAIAFSNLYAPEHLILACTDAKEISASVTAAGSVFIGNYSPEAAGDYASGTNHILPTNGWASMYSGVSLDSFVKMITYQELSREGLENIAPAVMEMAAAEGLEGHRRAIAIRLSK